MRRYTFQLCSECVLPGEIGRALRRSAFAKYTLALLLLAACYLIPAADASAQERLCDTSFEDCRQPLWDLIDAETQGIDFSLWFIQDSSYVTKLIARFNAGVPVRVLCDPRASQDYSGNQQMLDQLRAAGIPMRYKLRDGILHMKMMLFAGQNKVEFSGANYGPSFFVPSQPYQNYIDEAIYFTDDSAVVNSFKTKFDDLWTDTTSYGNYANITGPLTRRYPIYTKDPALNFPPSTDDSEDFYNRTALNMNQERTKIDIIMYRITNDRYTNTTINAVSRGVPVRLITEQNEYRNPSRQWDAYNVDLMYNAGVQIRIRAHQGLNHEKVAMLYGLGMTIFSSSNWTGPSSNYQQENNYFTTKTWFFQWFVNHFERKWNSTETMPFTPLPPDVPSYVSPANNATGQPVNGALTWEGGRWAHKFDIYFGTNSNPPLVASDQFIGRVDNTVPESYALPALAPGTKYYWRIVSKTMANVTASGPIWCFTTAGSPNPPPSANSVSPNSGPTTGGTSITVNGSGFLSGARVTFGGTDAANVIVSSSSSITATSPPHASGVTDVVVTNTDGQSGALSGGFTYTAPPPPPAGEIVLYAAEAPVRVGNWSVAADPTAAGGARIWNPDSGAPKVATPLASPTSYFEMTFAADAGRAYRLWLRGKAQNDNPFNDSVHIQFSDSVNSNGAPISRISSTTSQEVNLEDCSGCGLSGWGWQDNGWGVGVMGPLLYFQITGTHTIRIQVREDGFSIDQIVLSPTAYLNASPGALKNDTIILGKTGVAAAPSPTIGSVSPNSGTTIGGTSVTISGTGFANGATVSFGGAAATGVTVSGTASISAVAPAHAAGLVDVVVTNPDGNSGTGNGAYTYVNPQNPAPTITSITPSSGPTAGGTTVTISGSNFVSGASVLFGGTSATNVNVVSSSSISANSPPKSAGPVDIVVTNPDQLSGTLPGGFTYTAPAGEIILLQDDFNDNSLDTTKWIAGNLFSGFTDAALPISENGQRIVFGPMLQGASGSHYNGIKSNLSYDLTGAYCFVKLDQPPAANTGADAMFTIGKDANNYYRIYVESGSLICQKRIGGTKTNLFTAAYNAGSHTYLRIRHDAATGSVVFDAAPDAGGTPGTWTELCREAWNTTSVPITAVIFELKAGTWQSEANAPGSVIFDTFKSARP